MIRGCVRWGPEWATPVRVLLITTHPQSTTTPHPNTLFWLYHGLLGSQVINIKRCPDTSRRHSQRLSVKEHTVTPNSVTSEVHKKSICFQSFIHLTAAMWKDSSNGKESFIIYQIEEKEGRLLVEDIKNNLCFASFIHNLQPCLSFCKLFV